MFEVQIDVEELELSKNSFMHFFYQN